MWNTVTELLEYEYSMSSRNKLSQVTELGNGCSVTWTKRTGQAF